MNASPKTATEMRALLDTLAAKAAPISAAWRSGNIAAAAKAQAEYRAWYAANITA